MKNDFLDLLDYIDGIPEEAPQPDVEEAAEVPEENGEAEEVTPEVVPGSFGELVTYLEENKPEAEEPEEAEEETEGNTDPSVDDLFKSTKDSFCQWLLDHGIQWSYSYGDIISKDSYQITVSITVMSNGVMKTANSSIMAQQSERRFDIFKRLGRSMAWKMFPDEIRKA